LHRRFIFCGTVRSRNLASLARTARRVSPLALPGALPFGLRRPAPKTFVLDAIREDHGVRTFLPAGLLAKAGPAITRPARHTKYIIFQRLPVHRMARKNTQRRKHDAQTNSFYRIEIRLSRGKLFRWILSDEKSGFKHSVSTHKFSDFRTRECRPPRPALSAQSTEPNERS
jgi:hypothetical protein